MSPPPGALVRFSLLAVLGAASASASPLPRLRWGPCNQTDLNTSSSAVPMDCSTLRVPLDYSRPMRNNTLTLQLARAPAPIQPSRGSILTNFGGPGEPGRRSLVTLAGLMQVLSGHQYDIIAFDTRGTENTLPMICFTNDVDLQTMLAEWSVTGNSSETAQARIWARGAVNAEACYRTSGAIGELMGTAFVARDLMSVVDALEEDSRLRFWGLSYGTTLGATVVSMFPDRVDKVLLDGVQNPHEYYHALADFEEWTMADATLLAVMSECIEAGPSLCKLARRQKTAPQLVDAVWALLEAVKKEPLAIGIFLVDYSALKSFIWLAIKGPAGILGVGSMTDVLDLLLDGDLAGVDEMLSGSPGLVPAELPTTMALVGIHCSDRTARAANLAEFRPVLAELYGASQLSGDITDGLVATCAQWRMSARERYAGDFRVRPAGPVLLVGNRYDAFTPLVSAYNVSAGFEGSAVLETDGFGHCAITQPSRCTLEKLKAFWLDGTLPANGTVCAVDAPLYGNGTTWEDVLPATGEATSSAGTSTPPVA